MSRTRATVALVAVNLLWAAQYPALAVAGRALGPGTLAFWQVAGGLAVVGAAELLGPRLPRGQGLAPVALLGVVGIALPAVLLPWGIARSSASQAALLSLTVPLLMTLFAWPVLGERLRPRTLGALALGLAGAALACRRDLAGSSLDPRWLAGSAAILGAAAANAFYNTAAKRLAPRVGPLAILTGSYVAALGPTLLFAATEPVPPWRADLAPTATLVAVLAAGVLPWGLGMVLWLRVLTRLEAARAAVSIYLLPGLGIALAALVLRERPPQAALLGAVLAAVATALATTAPVSPERSQG